MYDSGMSLAAVCEAIRALEMPVDGDSIACALRAMDELAAKVSEATGEFDRLDLWDAEAATSLVAWLRDRGNLTARDAAYVSRRARRLRSCPATRQAWLDGSLSGGQVEAVVANVSDRTAALFVEHEPGLVPDLVPLSAADTANAMRSWAAHADAVVDPAAGPDEPRRSLRLGRTLDGRAELQGSLDAEGAGIVEVALRLAITRDDVDAGDRERSAAERRGDALVDVCRRYLDTRSTDAPGRSRPHLNVIVRHDEVERRGQGRLLDGTVLDGVTMQRLLCDADLHRLVVTGRSTILDHGRRTRTVSPELFTALAARDGHCRAPGCDRPPDWTEAHHVVPWHAGGATAADNLVLLCPRHHHRFHRPGWELKLRPDATLEVTDPAGRVRTTDPPGW
jgi:hypothetical protein